MSDISKVFSFNELQVRTHIDEMGNPWFSASDVCAILDLTNVGNAIARLDEEEHRDIHSTDVSGRQFPIVFINESGLYSLVLTSRKPEAKVFKKWITSEVLPSIRKTGSYTKDLTEDEISILRLEDMLRLAKAKREHERKIRIIEIEQKQQMEFLTKVDTKVEKHDTMITQMMTHRSGGDNIPEDTIVLPNIRKKYFIGINQAIISDWLDLIGHARIPYTYVVGNTTYHSYCYAKKDLDKAYQAFLSDLEFKKMTPTGYKCKSKRLGVNLVMKTKEFSMNDHSAIKYALRI